MTVATYPLGAWAEYDTGWDQDTGTPGIILFNNAVQVWAVLQNRPDVTVADAAKAFNVPPHRVVEAINDHAWMYLDGPDDDYSRLIIGHDGE